MILEQAKQAVAEAGSQRRYAMRIGLSPTALSFALRQKMALPKVLLDALGYERVETVGYRKKDGEI